MTKPQRKVLKDRRILATLREREILSTIGRDFQPCNNQNRFTKNKQQTLQSKNNWKHTESSVIRLIR